MLSRYFGITTPIDTTAGKKLYAELADHLLDKQQPDIYNQAIMDLGATVCLPRNPLCAECLQQADCKAWQKGLTAQLPIKEKSIQKKQRWFYYFIVETPDGEAYIRQRTAKDIWEGLYEFVLWERDEPAYFDNNRLPESEFLGQLFGRQSLTVRYISKVYRQDLSHQTIQGQFLTVRLKSALAAPGDYIRVSRSRLSEFAFPKFINAWLLDPTPAQSLF